ncbi:interleukin-like EMT inducer protein [Fadolivirus algeromassiliense]|jgi:hypothetical protein|uniref:Interleukin-like EMT inducer protein n=1 Tax=Fadolivirus FV1/VV64 TaxID=3070911 RepID=A0A7D3UUD9_9VIRU|nr:interleukin-like EMT inducer protein [Fadolivirus algeromassiliense]QKF94071.1 interleukin-like EMT inducer protein [Fadolivirus FV1/VV64]
MNKNKYIFNNKVYIVIIIILLILISLSCCCSYILKSNNIANNIKNSPIISNIPVINKIINNTQNYETEIKTVINVKYNDIINDFYNILMAMSSKKKAMVIVGDKIILDGGNNGLNFIVFDRGDKLVLKYIQSFDIGCCRNNILSMIQFIENIKQKDIVIITSKGKPFILFSNKNDHTSQLGIKYLKQIGARTEIFREDDNYILITSRLGDIYYEDISPESLYFPYINIIKKDCKINPGNIKYPEKYIIFNDKAFDSDKLKKCAMESHIRGYTKFGLYDNYCIPMSDNEYYNSFEIMPDSEKCLMEHGGKNDITGYHIEKIYSYDRLIDNRKHGVIFYELHNFEGDNFILNEGVYLNQEINRQRISSVYIPYKYFLFIILDDEIIPFYGPIKVNLKNFYKKNFDDFDVIIIQKHHENNTVLCAQYKNKKICMTYGKGTHIFYPKMYFRITDINIGDNVNTISLYATTGMTDLIDKFDRKVDGKNVKVKFPRITRSIIIS